MAPEKEKITTMILYVDLKCTCCYKKVRKLLCKFPQIRDQVFDVEKNKVTTTVVCCDPERFRDKLCCKGGRAIQSIEIVEDKPPPPKPTPDPPSKPKPPVENKTNGKAKPPPAAVVPVPEMPKPVNPPKPQPQPKPRPPPEPRPQPPTQPIPRDGHHPPQPPPQRQPDRYQGMVTTHHNPNPNPKLMPMNGYHPHQPFCPPVSVCCQECYEGWDGGPCHYGYGRLVPPPPSYDYYGYQYPPNRPCYVSRCDYFSEDNPQGCSIM